MNISQLEIVPNGLAQHILQFTGVLGMPIEIYVIDLADRVIITTDQIRFVPPSLLPYAEKMIEGYLLLGYQKL